VILTIVLPATAVVFDMSKRTRSLSQNSPTDSFETIVENHVNYRPARVIAKRKTSQDVINFNTTFKPIDNKKFQLYMKNLNIKVQFQAIRSLNNLSDIFYKIMDDELIDKIIEYNSSQNNLKHLPTIFSKTENTRTYPDIKQAKRNCLLTFYGIKLYIQHNPAKTLRENFADRDSIIIPNFEEFKMCFDYFEKMNSHFFIPIALVKVLNDKLNSLVESTGRIVCMDEKHKKCHQNHLHARYAKKKPRHWITESAILGPTTGLPYMIQLMPTTTIDRMNAQDEPFNNKPVAELVEEAYSVLDDNTILLTDGYYPDMNGRRYCIDNDKLYIFKASKKRFPELFEKAKEHINERKKDDFVVLYSEETNEHFMMYNSFQTSTPHQKGVLTNAFSHRIAPKNYPPTNVIQLAYQTYFNFDDRFNHYLNNRFWPYKRNTWQSNYDDFFFGVIQMNIYTIWHEVNKLTEDNILWSQFTLDLSTSLFNSLRISNKKY